MNANIGAFPSCAQLVNSMMLHSRNDLAQQPPILQRWSPQSMFECRNYRKGCPKGAERLEAAFEAKAKVRRQSRVKLLCTGRACIIRQVGSYGHRVTTP